MTRHPIGALAVPAYELRDLADAVVAKIRARRADARRERAAKRNSRHWLAKLLVGPDALGCQLEDELDSSIGEQALVIAIDIGVACKVSELIGISASDYAVLVRWSECE